MVLYSKTVSKTQNTVNCARVLAYAMKLYVIDSTNFSQVIRWPSSSADALLSMRLIGCHTNLVQKPAS